MGRAEHKLIKDVQIFGTRRGWRLFRNNVGLAWQGRVTEEYEAGSGRVVELYHARRVKFGLCPGSSDLIGWEEIEITPDMVGQRIARFVAIECKTSGYRHLTDEQRRFLTRVTESGGFAGVARYDSKERVIIDCLGISKEKQHD